MPLDVHATEEEDKLVVLSSLNRLGGCTEEQLLRFLVENALMNQFQFYLALGGLKEAGFVREARHLEGTLLILTPQGRESVEMFASRIRASQTEKLNANAPHGSGASATSCKCPPRGRRRTTASPSRCARWRAARKSSP